MRKIFGLLFVLTLVLIPISFKVKAENSMPPLNASGTDDSTSTIATSTDATSTPAVSTSTDSGSKNPIVILRNLIMKSLEQGAQANSADTNTFRSRFSFFQRRFEEILRRLNNTD